MKLYNSITIIKQKHSHKYHITAYLQILFVSSTLIICSCRKFVEIDPPKNQLIGETVFSTNETATAALLNIYSLMRSVTTTASPYYTSLYMGLSSDELKNYSTSISIQQIYVNNIAPIGASTNNIWNTGYNFIYRANAIIEGCENATKLSEQVKQQLTSEALFVRAFWHFYLLNLYGKIPLVTGTDYNMNALLTQTESSLVYKKIIEDLIAAQSNLKDNYIGLDGVSSSQERVRINKAAATALLARVYLYTKNYSAAEEQSSKVIDQKSTYRLVSLDSVFLKNSQEAIWQLMVTTPNTSNTPEGSGFILTNKPSGINNSSTISPQLMTAFEDGDQRKISWIGKFTDRSVVPNVDYYFPYKYKVKTGAAISEYSMVLRLGEQYLIRAEARAEQGNLIGAIEDVDIIRARAGLALFKSTNPNMGKEDLLAAIGNERRTELFTEWGHRWFDLKRTGKVDDVMSRVTIEKGGSWNSNKQFWPIPPKDIDNNPKLVQNPGYN